MRTYVNVNPKLIRWAIDRSGLSGRGAGHPILDKAESWLVGDKKPTLRMLEDFAKKVMVPLGYLFLDEPPIEQLPIADYRTFDDSLPKNPSPNLIDTIHDMQLRQEWMRDYLIEIGAGTVPFIGTLNNKISIVDAARQIKKDLGLPDDWSRQCDKWADSFKILRNAIDQVGILVFTNGVVRLNTSRPLDPEEFRGFVLLDKYAPLIFVNRNDTTSAQIFTLIHEVAHIWMGRSGLFNLQHWEPSADQGEKYCNKIAAEFLLPEDDLLRVWQTVSQHERPFRQLASLFKISPIVAARRAFDKQLISRNEFFQFYTQEQERWEFLKEEKKQKKQSGGDFHATQSLRFSKRFIDAIAASVGEGSLTYHDAYQLTGMRGKTFDHFLFHVQKTEQYGGED